LAAAAARLGSGLDASAGTGPFKFVEYKPNQNIKLVRNPDYWKPGLPYLDGIEYTIIPNRSTAILAFVAGQFDMTFPYEVSIPLLKDVKDQSPKAICEVGPATEATNVIMSRTKPPFDKPEIRRAVALSVDRKAFIDIIGEGQGDIGGAMQPLPEGVWGMPRPMIYHLRLGTCWHPHVKNLTLMSNSIYNGWRMEDWWLDK